MKTTDDASARPRAQVPSEVLLLLVSLVAVAGFTRLFSDDGAVVGLLVAAVVAHVANAVARRLGLGGLGTAGLLGGVLLLQASFALYPHLSLAGLPTGTTLSTASDDLRRAWDLFGDVRAPAPSERGFLLAATIAIWLAASLADWAGLRLRATAEAVLPAGALFVFTILLGQGGDSVLTATLLAASILGFALAQRTARSATEDTWVGGQASAGVTALARSGGVAVVLVAVGVGLVVPLIPGTRGEGIIEWRTDRAASRTTISPLVDIRSRLVQQSDTVAFRVQAERPAYWRLTSLDEFDGELWSSSDSFSDADGRLPSEPPDATTRELVQTFSISDLGTIWAPAALTPVDIQSTTTDLRWNGELATLIVRAGIDDIDRARYQVVSRIPEFAPEDLGAALPDQLPDELEDAIELPDGVPPEVFALAREATAEVEPTPYAQARALQDWFRRGFTYDLVGVRAGHSDNAISAFLSSRRGYCEQFAGTFAAMARSLGLPARVAVGFTPGEVDETGTTYTVRGRNAHAWPEVFIPGAGWVPFEPTPGRGQPGTETYTGVAPAQNDTDPLPSTSTSSPAETTPGTAPPATSSPRPPTTPPDVDQRAEDLPLAPSSDDSGSGPAGVALTILALVVGVILLDVAGLAGRRALHRRRRRRAAGVLLRVRLAWDDAVTATSRLGPPPEVAETDAEYAARAAPAIGAAAPALARLAALAARATWAPAGREADPDLAREADDLARQVDEEARRRLTWSQKLRLLVDPRSAMRAR